VSLPQPDSLQPKKKNLLPLVILCAAVGLVSAGMYDYLTGGKLGATSFLQSLFAKPMTAEQTAKVKELQDNLDQLKQTRDELAAKIGKLPSTSDDSIDRSESSPTVTPDANSKPDANATPEPTTPPTADEGKSTANPAENGAPQTTDDTQP